MAGRFLVRGVFRLSAREVMVIYGDITEGVIKAGSQLCVPLSPALTVTIPVNSVEFIDGTPTGSHVALVVLMGDAVKGGLLSGHDFVGTVLDVNEPAKAADALSMALLPGMDGTGDLFADLVDSAPAWVRPFVVELPPIASYEELARSIRDQLPESGSFAVLAESFSGPLALRVARDFGDRVTAVILANSFVTPPRGSFFRLLPWSLLLSVPPPRWAIHRFLVGPLATPATVSAVQKAIAKTRPKVLAERLRAVLELNDEALLTRTAAPILYLRGTDDVLVPARMPERIQQLRPDAVVTKLAAPHLLFQTAPRPAWAGIEKFMNAREKG